MLFYNGAHASINFKGGSSMATTKNVKEEIEVKAAVSAVEEAEQKVADIKAEKAAKKTKKQADRLAKHPKLGKVINYVEDNAKPIGIGIAIGGPIGVGVAYGVKKAIDHFSAKNAEEVVEDPTDEEVETDTTPFD
jgi:preprotein translocase subunit SecF